MRDAILWGSLAVLLMALLAVALAAGAVLWWAWGVWP